MTGYNQRPLGAGSYERIPPRTCSTTSAVNSRSHLAATTASDREGGWEAPPEESCRASVSIRGPVSEQDLLGSQEGWVLSTSVQPSAPELLHGELPLQDGGAPSCERQMDLKNVYPGVAEKGEGGCSLCEKNYGGLTPLKLFIAGMESLAQ